MSSLSPLRDKLAGFPNCYAIALQRQKATGRNQFVIRTGVPIQPFRVTEAHPLRDDDLVLRVA